MRYRKGVFIFRNTLLKPWPKGRAGVYSFPSLPWREVRAGKLNAAASGHSFRSYKDREIILIKTAK